MTKIREYHDIFKQGGHYSKSLHLIQSNGTRKSRLADKYGEIFPMITYVLRRYTEGFPPGNNEILKFMRSHPTFKATQQMSLPKRGLEEQGREERILIIWFYAIAIGILCATFETCK
jgi:hypothetical protein